MCGKSARKFLRKVSNKQTNRQTDKQRRKHILRGGGNYCFAKVPLMCERTLTFLTYVFITVRRYCRGRYTLPSLRVRVPHWRFCQDCLTYRQRFSSLSTEAENCARLRDGGGYRDEHNAPSGIRCTDL